MKKVLLSVVAATTLATALPALAQPYGNAYGHPQNRGYDQRHDRDWAPIGPRAGRLQQRIDRGVQNGQITRREANRLRMQLIQIVRLEGQYRHNGLSFRERQDLDRRFDMLSAQVRYERRDDDRRRDRDWDDRRDDRRGDRRGY